MAHKVAFIKAVGMRLRIKEMLKRKGVSITKFANDLEYDQGQVSRWLNGTRRANTEFLNASAKYFNVSVPFLFERPKVPVVGYIGAGSEAHYFDDFAKGGGDDYVEAPIDLPNSAVGVRVRGTSMFPALLDGDVIVYSEQRVDFENLLQRRLICRLSDGRTMIKILSKGAAHGLFTLISFNAEPIEDVALDWVAEMDCIIPR